MTTIMQPFQCDLQPQIPRHPINTHAVRQKKSKPTAAATAAHRRYLSSPAAATLHGKTQGFVLRLPPQHKPHATFMQPLQCVLQHHVANLHVSTHMATSDDNNHAAIPMRSATTDSKTPNNYARTSTPKAAWSHRYSAAKKQANRPQPQPPHTGGTFYIAGCSHFTRKNSRFRAPASSPKQSPFNIHAVITMRFAASRRKPARIYAHGNTRWQQSCSHSNAICNHRLQNTQELRTHKHTQSSLKPPLQCGEKKGKPTAAATAAHRRYLSSPAAATLHGKTQGFVFRLPPQHKPRATFMQPSQCILQHSLHHHFPSSPLRFVTTSFRHHFPKSPLPFVTTSLPHHFPSSPLRFVTTSQKVTTLPSSPLPFGTTSLIHHFPKSPHSLRHQFP